MCGIIGVLGDLPGKDLFKRSRDAMSHRGPDDGGTYYSLNENIALGHRRLSIIDTSSRGKQPLVSTDGNFVITFNGEIYNYRQLKEQINNYEFKTETDTEVLLAAYIKWGVKCTEKIEGMFAFAIWDRRKGILFLCRDRLGIKPLYYHLKNEIFYFASEIKGILNLSKIKRELDFQGFIDYLSYRYPLGDRTLFRDIKSFPPGHYMIISNNRSPKVYKYWDLPVVIDKNDPGEAEVLENTEMLLKKSVQSHMISDVPIGAYLSGGLDSALLVGLMSSFSNDPINTFSIGFKEKGFNEFKYSREVAKKFKTNHNEYLLKSDDYLEFMTKVIRYKDSPLTTHNEISLHLLSKYLKKDATVVLSGDGADELFGGYGRIFRSGYDFDRIKKLQHYHNPDKDILVKNLMDKYKSFNFNTPIEHFMTQYPYLKLNEKRLLLNREIFNTSDDYLLNKEYFTKVFNKIQGLSTSEQYLYVFQQTHILGPLYRLDAATMAHSVEARVPFVDHKLIEYVSGLPLKYKLSWRSKKDKELSRVLNSDQGHDY